ncbi:survival protein sure-likephosphatase/nucleotidase-like protein [Xylariales sp. PMI_506]|nr:survival protein sure-likephosphatase/nucleotidase-like protein [Xylariales sp. PMI_506]
MRVEIIASTFCILVALGARVLQSNDDGWAELYLRSLNEALNDAGHDVVLSAPADNKSGTGSRDEVPTPRREPCQYNSCSAGSGPVGSNVTDSRLNWVNSFPVTSVKYGLETVGPRIWDGQFPDLVVSGPNVGGNLWLQLPFSGTVGVAVYAASTAKVPSIAFSGASGGNLPWDTSPVPTRSKVYAQLATNLTNALLASGSPYLPENVWLNVNFPRVEGDCTESRDFTWILSRSSPGYFSERDVKHCGRTRLPTETEVQVRGGCRISVSMGDALATSTAPRDKQEVVLSKIRHLLTCLD